MNLHEFQAKQLLRERGLAVPDGVLVEQPEAVPEACARLGGTRWVVKAQIHSGGRGQSGGVVLVEGPDQAERETRRLLGSRLVTHQTGLGGLPVGSVLIERPTAIVRELYLGLLVDRTSEQLLFIASSAGGMDIERVAAETPEQILRVPVPLVVGVQPYQARRLGFGLGLDEARIQALGTLMERLYRLFIDTDASLIEINPLVLTDEGDLLALDAKIRLDDNALIRHPALAALHDPSQEDPRETAARAHALNYIHLDGHIGCMVNGAGLAMATLDLIKLQGGQPANFLDVGGGATAARVAEAFKLILSDPKVAAILVNIFGGIVRCDLIAEGIIQAVREVGVSVPIVVRLEGTNAALGRRMLAESGLALQTAEDLEAAAALAVAAAQRGLDSGTASHTVDGEGGV
ncbi:ADP-forming succinate--CoA ligase subunit beta [Thermochromatium tepidum]|jgi:succinyl-CoA synthetase (ADP-forming) beta subunit (EC 6.2.1.5)|uniref:Succinate--CoA ligase [ADP-forming] subunit beta n=1 Tax=Thermochromatium tepidum ATCC 43061 TaxID=316276 RepID=A0A6I6EHY0_THETI|nr:ADP-forming succinate--CoA ligase subunit beta [Thermochromatium tepidum]QGU32857.1 ADP-forming succinate--CoA ligase subunit beta [Thermochromatium tepidum ATCC 43061]